MRRLSMDNKILLARIDLLGMGVADTAKYIKNDNDLLWTINQATVALQEAYRKLADKVAKERMEEDYE